MLFDYLYILNNFDPVFFRTGQAPADFAIPVNNTVLNNQVALFQTLFHAPGRFCFSVSDNIAGGDKLFIQKDIVQHFTRLFFLPNYLRADGKYVLVIDPLTSSIEASRAVAAVLTSEFKKQGIDILCIEAQQPGAPAIDAHNQAAVWHQSLIDFTVNAYSQQGFELFIKDFRLPLVFNKKWLIPVTGPADLQRKQQQLEKFELWLKGTQPFKVQLIEMLSAAAKANSTLATENKLLSFKLENSGHYLQLIREESMGLIHEIGKLRAEIQRGVSRGGDSSMQAFEVEPELIVHYQTVLMEERKRADETLNWYKNEYEVLPLWFKRMGQLIKVLMGKRSFRSLFKKSKNDQGRKNTQ